MNDQAAMRNRHLLAFVALLAAFLMSVALRWDAVVETPGSAAVGIGGSVLYNHETTLQFADALQAQRRLPLSVHGMAPLLSPDDAEIAAGRGLSGGRDVPAQINSSGQVDTWKTLPWRVTNDGYLVYTSFPPGGFAAVGLLLRAAAAEPTPDTLLRLSLAIQAACVALLYALLWTALLRPRVSGLAAAPAVVVCAAAASAYVFATQPLHDHVATFWAHHLLQPIILASVLVQAADPGSRARSVARAVALGALAFAGAATEWSGHLLNAALVATSLGLALPHGRERGAHLMAAAAVAVGGLGALVWTVGVFASQIGFDEYVSLMLERRAYHAGDEAWASFLHYSVVLMRGCGPYLAFALVAALLALIDRLRGAPATGTPETSAGARWRPRAALACLAVACSENALLTSHAVANPFATLKVVLLVSCLVALALRAVARRDASAGAGLAVAGAALSALASIAVYDVTHGRRLSLGDVPMSQRACMQVGRQSAREVAALSGGEVVMAGIGILEHNLATHFPGPYAGRRAAPVDTLEDASRLMDEIGATAARVFVIGGQDVERPGDSFVSGRVSADVVLRAGGGNAAIRLHPARPGTPAAGQGGRLRFHNRAAALLAAPGDAVATDAGERLVVAGVFPADGVVEVRRLDGSEPSGPQPRWIAWEGEVPELARSTQLRSRLQGRLSVGDDVLCSGLARIPGTGRLPIPGLP